jgi:hypothetical protein
MPLSCGSPSAISCIPLSGGSYSWLGCYKDTTSATGFSVSVGVQVTGFTGTATDCITACSTGNDGAAYNYASIEVGSCYSGTSVSSSAPVSASLCNIFCSNKPSAEVLMVHLCIARHTFTIQVAFPRVQLYQLQRHPLQPR